MTANPIPDPFTVPPTGFVPTGVTQRQLDAAAEYKPDLLEEFFASGFTMRQLDALAEHAGFYLRTSDDPGLRAVADAVDRARDLPWREANQ